MNEHPRLRCITRIIVNLHDKLHVFARTQTNKDKTLRYLMWAEFKLTAELIAELVIDHKWFIVKNARLTAILRRRIYNLYSLRLISHEKLNDVMDQL